MIRNPNVEFFQHPVLGPAIAAEAHRIMAAEGPAALASSKRAAAYHECGHVLANALLGTPATGVEISCVTDRGLSSWIGRCTGSPGWLAHERTDPFSDFKVATRIAAGYLAERHFCPSECTAGSSLDERIIATSICNNIAIKLGVSRDTVADAVDDFLITNYEAHAGAMHKAAGILMTKGRLTERQLDKIFELALPGAWAIAFYEFDPEAAERELEQARREIAAMKRAARDANRRLMPTVRRLGARP